MWLLLYARWKKSFARIALLLGMLAVLPGAKQHLIAQTPPSNPSSTFDAETQALIAQSERVVFLIPFSHWDTDWHQSFDVYSQMADQNIIKAIQIAKQAPRFRYTLEQVLFVQHFWDAYPDYRADLKALVQNRQFSFAWGGITQPETSLVAPAIQVRNLQLGLDWIAQTFGSENLPRTAWQSDAFGNSAAFPTFLSQSGIPYLYIGRWQGRCDPDYQQCQPLPPAFYWTSPAAPPGEAGRVLVTYNSYPTAWYDIYHFSKPEEQIANLRAAIEKGFAETNAPYLFLPLGFDFFSPKDNLPAFVDTWNAADSHTKLVMSDPDSAFQYLATQPLPEITIDLNPIWQAFYNTRPAAKIADKESEYYLTAADKLGLLLNMPASDTWHNAAINAHYDNISGVSFDKVWETSQRPRFEATVASAQANLSQVIASIASRVAAPVVVFNPTSWSRSGVIELTANLPDVKHLPGTIESIGSQGVAFRVQDVPSLGYLGLTDEQKTAGDINHPATVTQDGSHITLSNGLVSLTVDGDYGGTFSSLALLNDSVAHEFLSTFGDDVTYRDDGGPRTPRRSC